MVSISRFLFCLILLLSACDDKPVAKKTQKAAAPPAEKPLFRLLPSSSTGINFSNRLPETPQLNVLEYTYYYNGGGVAVGDVNNDDLPDVFFSGNLIYNKLYLNQGNMKFADITEKAGVKGRDGWRTGTAMADVNADGWMDIYVCYSGKLNEPQRRNELFINNGNGTFSDKAAEYGLDDPGYGTQVAFLDYDRDGDMDIYLLNHQIIPANLMGKSLNELRNTSNPYSGDKLFRNEGPGQKFTDVSSQAGLISNHIGYGLGIAVGDLNGDYWPDLYVSNDFMEPDYLYINQKNGTFKEALADQIGHTPFYSMGNDMGDINNDGWLDIIATDMMPEGHFRQKTNMASMSMETFWKRVEAGFHYQYMYNTLQVNNGSSVGTSSGNPTFSDVGKLAGISKTDWSWATLFADYNNDGREDLFITNGMRKETWNNDFRAEKARRVAAGQPMPAIVKDLLPTLTSQKIPNYIFENQGDLSFAKVGKSWGIHQAAFSNGAAYADLDNDGDLDLVVNNIDEAAFVYENQVSTLHPDRHYLQVKLEGDKKNPNGIGARVELRAGDKIWTKDNHPSRGFQSSVDRKLHFGLGETASINTLTVTWSDGSTQQLKDVPSKQVLTLKKEDAKGSQPKFPPPTKSLFVKGPDLKWKHQENEYNDYNWEVLLPHKMSTLGPALATGDVNGDGLDDFYVGGAKGQSGSLFLQASNGNFSKKSGPWSSDKSSEDIAATFFDADSDGDQDLYVVSGSNELPAQAPDMQDRLYLNNGKGTFTKANGALPSIPISGGCVAANDFDGDGDQDLFVGGRQLPRKYPFPPRSYLLQNDGGKFTDITEVAGRAFQQVGMVSSAIWADVNGDTKTDLVLAGEWMAVSVFIQENGKFVDKTQDLGLIHSTGWWYSLAAADVDKDGDIDLIGGNLGLNYKYKATPEKPFRIYSGDFDKNGQNDIVLAYNEGSITYPLRGRECSSQQIPDIKKKFPNYQSFGNATLFDVYGIENLNQNLQYKAETFASTWFENKGDTFEAHPLPNEAQISSVHGIVPMDCNSDGHLDLIMAGNLFDSEVETPRNDGGIGLVLLGDGKGSFEAVPARESGFFAPGNVKALAPVRTTTGFGVIIGRNDDEISVILNKIAIN